MFGCPPCLFDSSASVSYSRIASSATRAPKSFEYRLLFVISDRPFHKAIHLNNWPNSRDYLSGLLLAIQHLQPVPSQRSDLFSLEASIDYALPNNLGEIFLELSSEIHPSARKWGGD